MDTMASIAHPTIGTSANTRRMPGALEKPSVRNSCPKSACV
jgi:hypothetical protein